MKRKILITSLVLTTILSCISFLNIGGYGGAERHAI